MIRFKAKIRKRNILVEWLEEKETLMNMNTSELINLLRKFNEMRVLKKGDYDGEIEINTGLVFLYNKKGECVLKENIEVGYKREKCKIDWNTINLVKRIYESAKRVTENRNEESQAKLFLEWYKLQKA